MVVRCEEQEVAWRHAEVGWRWASVQRCPRADGGWMEYAGNLNNIDKMIALQALTCEPIEEE
uniref:Uncharacterized protein n=1 Tax=Oryza punctata TaxID=4537 RepID=A0A0E0LSY8_ORYPU